MTLITGKWKKSRPLIFRMTTNHIYVSIPTKKKTFPDFIQSNNISKLFLCSTFMTLHQKKWIKLGCGIFPWMLTWIWCVFLLKLIDIALIQLKKCKVLMQKIKGLAILIFLQLTHLTFLVWNTLFDHTAKKRNKARDLIFCMNT